MSRVYTVSSWTPHLATSSLGRHSTTEAPRLACLDLIHVETKLPQLFHVEMAQIGSTEDRPTAEWKVANGAQGEEFIACRNDVNKVT